MTTRCELTHEDRERITSQRGRVREFMLGRAQWLTLNEISTLLALEHGGHFPEASISARLRDLRKNQYGAYRVARRRRSKGLYEYKVLSNGDGASRRCGMQPTAKTEESARLQGAEGTVSPLPTQLSLLGERP